MEKKILIFSKARKFLLAHFVEKIQIFTDTENPL
jgi:hypothetical protein